MQFKDVVGQQKLKEQLVKMVDSGRISHAQLFLGKLGHGSLPLAIAYAQYISCKNRSVGDSCGECPSCVKISKIAHPDLHFTYPFNTSKNIKSSNITSADFAVEWREMVLDNPYFEIADWEDKIELENKKGAINVKESQEIIRKLSFKPYEAEYKVLIIWMADNMNVDASNKLLKLIEEPTEKTIILLLAEKEENLLQTILSRTQIIRIPPIASEDLSEVLKVEGCDAEQAMKFAKVAEGDLIVAKGMVEQADEATLFFEMFKSWMRACYKADIQAMHKWVEEAASKKLGREGQKRFLSYALEVMREGILIDYTANKLRRFYGKEADFINNFAPFVHSENIIALMELLNDAYYHINRNAFAKIVFMDMSMKFANLLRVKKRTFVG